MTEVPRLTEAGRDVVNRYDEFESGSEVYELRDDLQDYVTHHQIENASINWEALDEAVNKAKTAFNTDINRERSAMDSMLAPLVRQYYDIPLRTAGQIGVWQYLTLIKYPRYVVARWEDHGDLKEKLLGEQNDLYSNQMGRLWWGGQLTYDPEDDHYYRAHKLFNKQRIANYVLDSEFRRCRPATFAFVDQVYNETTTTITEVGRRFNRSLSTYQMESRDEADFNDQLSTIVAYVSSG